MSYKIAFASTDGKTVNQKFHDANQFVIYEIFDEKSWKLSCTRKFSEKLPEQTPLTESKMTRTSCGRLKALNEISQCGADLDAHRSFHQKFRLLKIAVASCAQKSD